MNAHADRPDAAPRSTTADALAAAGDHESARDIGALDSAALAVEKKLAATDRGLVERLIYGPPPESAELTSGGRLALELDAQEQPVVAAALGRLAAGEAFTADGALADSLRRAVAVQKAYGYTVPVEFGGAGRSYLELARIEEMLAANGLGPLAVEISGELTIGAGALLAYGSEAQRKTFLPMIAEGRLMGFALTEVGVGVNAKKIQAYVEREESGDFRLFADGPRNKLWITNACHGALLRGVRWTYLGLSLIYQLELTRAQIPLQRLGLRIEHLVSMLVMCHHASLTDRSQQQVAVLQAQLQEKYAAIGLLGSLGALRRLRRATAAVGESIEADDCSLLKDGAAEPFAHSWIE